MEGGETGCGAGRLAHTFSGRSSANALTSYNVIAEEER